MKSLKTDKLLKENRNEIQL